MLGFGGHFATKSRRYSTTHEALRAARPEWRRATSNDWWNRHHPAVNGQDVEECVHARKARCRSCHRTLT